MAINNEEMETLCIEGELTNTQLASHFEVGTAEIYSWRSRHGLTINKCAAIREGKATAGKRTAEAIEVEIAKVQKAKADAAKKLGRAVERLSVLYQELKEAQK